MKNNTPISIVIPTLNELGNISPLIKRIDRSLQSHLLTYELIFIDDNSTDETREIVTLLSKKYPISLFTKVNEPGKAQSLLEGLKKAKYDYLCYIDADLQYPPEAIPKMLISITKGADIVVANRVKQKTSFLRQLASRTFMYVFGQLLHGINCDVQSGLKVFKREVFESMTIHPSPWTFDLEFLVKARASGYIIGTVPIIFRKRQAGETKIHLLEASYEIGLHAIRLKLELITQKTRHILRTIATR